MSTTVTQSRLSRFLELTDLLSSCLPKSSSGFSWRWCVQWTTCTNHRRDIYWFSKFPLSAVLLFASRASGVLCWLSIQVHCGATRHHSVLCDRLWRAHANCPLHSLLLVGNIWCSQQISKASHGSGGHISLFPVHWSHARNGSTHRWNVPANLCRILYVPHSFWMGPKDQHSKKNHVARTSSVSLAHSFTLSFGRHCPLCRVTLQFPAICLERNTGRLSFRTGAFFVSSHGKLLFNGTAYISDFGHGIRNGRVRLNIGIAGFLIRSEYWGTVSPCCIYLTLQHHRKYQRILHQAYLSQSSFVESIAYRVLESKVESYHPAHAKALRFSARQTILSDTCLYCTRLCLFGSFAWLCVDVNVLSLRLHERWKWHLPRGQLLSSHHVQGDSFLFMECHDYATGEKVGSPVFLYKILAGVFCFYTRCHDRSTSVTLVHGRLGCWRLLQGVCTRVSCCIARLVSCFYLSYCCIWYLLVHSKSVYG